MLGCAGLRCGACCAACYDVSMRRVVPGLRFWGIESHLKALKYTLNPRPCAVLCYNMAERQVQPSQKAPRRVLSRV